MEACTGTLVVHENGNAGFCSEELSGRCLGDHAFQWHRVFRSCRLAFAQGCPECIGRALAEAHGPRGLAGMA
jgi:hypothetical protein